MGADKGRADVAWLLPCKGIIYLIQKATTWSPLLLIGMFLDIRFDAVIA